MGEYTNMAQSMIRTIAGTGYMRKRLSAADEANEIAQQHQQQQQPGQGQKAAGRQLGADGKPVSTGPTSMVDRLLGFSRMRTAQANNRNSIRGGQPIGDVPLFGKGGDGNGQQ